MWCRGIRGATLAKANTREDILDATRDLLARMIEANQIESEAVACAFFTTTSDLNAEFPALAARQLGWTEVPLICAQELNVPSSLSGCIRVLILLNTEKTAGEIEHVYTRGAEALRPDMGAN
ncbi:MAG: chorismate mutase [Chloroflexi bacterium]|nr:chorismate mutase [Chloroflexota bacterium]